MSELKKNIQKEKIDTCEKLKNEFKKCMKDNEDNIEYCKELRYNFENCIDFLYKQPLIN